MSISILMGRGVEGCGVTKFALEMVKWYEKHDQSVQVLAVNDKTWTRKNSHPGSEKIDLFKLAKDPDVERMINNLNASKIVYLVSLPSVGHPEKCIAGFEKVLKGIKTKVVFIQLDHNILSIKRNACLQQAVDRADVIFSLSRYNPFCELIEGSKGLSALLEEPKHKVFDYQVGFDFDSVKKRFWKDVKEQDPKHHKWIGRTTSWKGYWKMFDFHNTELKPAGLLTTFEGIEKSPAFLGFKDYTPFHSLIHIKDPNTFKDFEYGSDAYVFGPYNNDEMLERMSRVGFGYQLSHLDTHYIERALEFTHCEIVCTGVVPVFRKSYGASCHSRVSGDPLTVCKNTGTIWFDDDDLPGTFEQIKAVHNDPVKRDEMRNAAYEFYRKHQDAEFVFAEIHKKVMKEINA